MSKPCTSRSRRSRTSLGEMPSQAYTRCPDGCQFFTVAWRAHSTSVATQPRTWWQVQEWRMAKLVSLIGSTHSPWFHARTSVPESELSAEGRRLLAWSARVQEAIQRARPDAIVILATDHFHQFFSSNMPQFIVGRMDAYQGTFSNEVREFKLPRVELRGNRALATDLIEGGFEHGFDFAFSDELRLDHACVVPSLIAQPSLDIPVVPVLTNTGMSS